MDKQAATTATTLTTEPIMEGEKSPIAGTKSADLHNEFFNTGRVGRRNAMPDILGNHCTTSTADLPAQLSSLSTRDDTDTSGGQHAEAGGSSTSGDCSNTPHLNTTTPKS